MESNPLKIDRAQLTAHPAPDVNALTMDHVVQELTCVIVADRLATLLRIAQNKKGVLHHYKWGVIENHLLKPKFMPSHQVK